LCEQTDVACSDDAIVESYGFRLHVIQNEADMALEDIGVGKLRTMIIELRSENDALRKENAALKEEIAELRSNESAIVEVLRQTKEERLRQLAERKKLLGNFEGLTRTNYLHQSLVDAYKKQLAEDRLIAMYHSMIHYAEEFGLSKEVAIAHTTKYVKDHGKEFQGINPKDLWDERLWDEVNKDVQMQKQEKREKDKRLAEEMKARVPPSKQGEGPKKGGKPKAGTATRKSV
jgi:hypothetical protein